jgi:hypothetical protein
MLYFLIKLNGIYDILCTLCILNIIEISYISNLHLSMIKKNKNDITKRFFAYWIFTYGIMRLSNNKLIIASSYFIEALFFTNEFCYGTLYIDKGSFVIFSSLLLGFLSYFL